MSNSTLTARVHELRELKRMADEINAQMEAITDEIKAHMTAENKEQRHRLEVHLEEREEHPF